MSKKKPKVKTTIISSKAMSKLLSIESIYAEKLSPTITRGQYLYCAMTSEDRIHHWHKILESIDNETQFLVESLRMTPTSVIVHPTLAFVILMWDHDIINIYASSDGTYWNPMVFSGDRIVKKILNNNLVTLIDVSEIAPLMCLYS